MDYHFEDFTERNYRRLLRRTGERWAFEPLGTASCSPHVLWRHDVDLSIHRALALARIEAEEGVRSTFLLLLHSIFYSLLETDVLRRARAVGDLGHELGLHFDPGFYGGFSSADDQARALAAERTLLEHLLERPVRVVSLHNPGTCPVVDERAERLGGMLNASARSVVDGYRFVSDSNGYWRGDRLADVLEGDDERLCVLTHPGWWTPEVLSPRGRIERCVRGRAAATLAEYGGLLARCGRVDVA